VTPVVIIVVWDLITQDPVDSGPTQMFMEFGFVQTLVKLTNVTAEVVGTDFVLHPPRKHMTALTLIPVPEPHPFPPTLLIFLLRQRSCLFKSPSHGRIKWTVGAIERIVAKPEVNHPGLHPDALIFQDIETLDPFGLATPFAFTSHDSDTSLQVTVPHIPRVPVAEYLFSRNCRHRRW
jgi:hypothetical protein